MFRRQPPDIWEITRRRIHVRDGGACRRCGALVPLEEAHIDHIVPLKSLGTNWHRNLRTLCRRCHETRLDPQHRAMGMRAVQAERLMHDWQGIEGWADPPMTQDQIDEMLGPWYRRWRDGYRHPLAV